MANQNFAHGFPFGITTVRMVRRRTIRRIEGVEDIEANESGVRPGPRLFSTGYLSTKWGRTYYKMGVAISSPCAHLEMELQLSKVLQHDLLKSYVRFCPICQQKRHDRVCCTALEFRSRLMRDLSCSVCRKIDATEHTTATSRRSYSSTKQATLSRKHPGRCSTLLPVAAILPSHRVGAGIASFLCQRTGIEDRSSVQYFPIGCGCKLPGSNSAGEGGGRAGRRGAPQLRPYD